MAKTAWRILVADNDPNSMQALGGFLSPLPASILEASSGAEALRLARAVGPDLIILDVDIPRPDGAEVAATLKRDRSTTEIPVILIGAYGGPLTKAWALEVGAEDFLVKPIDPEVLRARARASFRHEPSPLRTAALASGQLQAMSPSVLVQILEGERHTAHLRVTSGEAEGEIIFVNGAITRALQGPRRGEAAIYQLLTWREGTFHLAPLDGGSPPERDVEVPNQVLLLEGMRRLDELPALRATLPDPAVALEVPAGLRGTLARHLTGQLAMLVSLLDGTRTLDQVLTQSPFDDWMTLKIFRYLLGLRALAPVNVPPDRRSSPRIDIDIAVEGEPLPRLQKARALNLSPGGLFIQTPAPLEVGAQVLLRFQLADGGGPISVLGQVVWRNAVPDKAPGTGMGVKFLNLTASDQERIDRYLVQNIALQIQGMAEEA